MAAFTITPANIRCTATTAMRKATAGETLTPMNPVYKSTDGEWYKAANTGATVAAATGLCMNYAEDGGCFELVSSGGMVIGATMAAGDILVVGAAGILQLSSDNSTGDYVRVIGIAATSTLLELDIGVPDPVAKA